jgi:hypothetical protein
MTAQAAIPQLGIVMETCFWVKPNTRETRASFSVCLGAPLPMQRLETAEVRLISRGTR